MSLADAFAPAEARYRAQVMFQTWGHLYPKLGFQYEGEITFAVAGYGGICSIITANWGTLEDSPLLYEAMDQVFNKVDIDRRGVFKWTGKLFAYKNGNLRLTKGKVITLIKA